MISSPYVARLLDGLGGNESMDQRALICLAATSLASLQPVVRAVEMNDSLLFVLSKADLSQFLVNSGFGEWFSSTWIHLQSPGLVTGDRPASDSSAVPPEAYQKLTDSILREMEALGGLTAVRVDQVVVYGMTSRGLADFLGYARTAAQRNPEWQAYASGAPAVARGDLGTPPALEPNPEPQRNIRRRRP